MSTVLIDIPIHPPSLERLRAIKGVHVHLVEKPEERRRALPPELLQDVEILMCTFPPENFADLQRLRWLQITSSGYSQLFNLGLVERGIRAANGRGTFDIPIAEWNVAMMVNLVRNLRQMIRNQDTGVWDRSAQFQREIRNLTVGIWGYGGLGRATARLAKAMGMQVRVMSREGVKPARNVYCTPNTGDPEGILPDRVYLAGSEREFLGELDFLILAMPLTPATEGMIGEKELRSLPPSAFLLNPSRGPLVREPDLLQALREGWIAGAALDTHYRYPTLPDDPIWKLPNVICTPHISGSSLSPHFLTRAWAILIENVQRDLAGSPLLNELTTDQLLGR